MLTLHQAYEVQASILEYLRATYGFRERKVAEAFEKFITDEREGMFKGPYLSLKLPFVTSEPGAPIPLEIKPGFPPFAHQVEAFQRLTTREDHEPQPTILTTGTGSGKTEAFLFPLLDYCYRHAGRRGIKCIILYPMNALATDQAGRLAKTIWEDERLRGKITAGLFIGVGKDGKKFPKDMAESHIIENREAILDSPPDILLTNFKMLDYALMRAQYQRVWKHNMESPDLLRFLVLDELHTYDGAQGTDVANLIRRMKLKLGLQPGQLCPVGTSATIGSGEEAPDLLAQYASRVFGEEITRDAIIAEKRVSTETFFGRPKGELFNRMPSPFKLQSTILQTGEEYDAYLKRQMDLWQLDPSADEVTLGRELRSLRLVWDVIDVCSKGILTVRELIGKLNLANEEFRKLPEWDEAHRFSPKEAVVRSIVSLIAQARSTAETASGLVRLPLLYLQVQLWVRELSGILRQLSAVPAFTWRDKSEKEALKAFPPYFCRECGASGWVVEKHDNRNQLEDDAASIYQKYFSNHKNVFFLNTDSPDHQHIAEYNPSEFLHTYINQGNLKLHDKEGAGRLGVFAYRQVKNNHNVHVCPECNSRNTLNIIGGRVSTLGSVTTSQLLASDLDKLEEKDRKLLIFSNGVQDAAHLAGFVEARNYRFAFRTSLQKVVNLQDGPLSLQQLQEAFIKYWKEHADESGEKGEEAYLYKFFPSDRLGEVKIEAYKQGDGRYKPSFVKEFDTRVRWEIASEFGFNAIIGRTLEKTGSSAAGFSNEAISRVFPAIKPWLEQNMMGNTTGEEFEKFLGGLLHRIRIRGGVDHDYLSKYRTGKYKTWELNWMNDKRHYLNRRFVPQARLPRMVTVKEGVPIELDTTFTKQDNWFHSYFRKSFPALTYPDALNEFYEVLLPVLASEEVGILNKATALGMENFCIEPASLLTSNRVVHLDCEACGHRLSVEKTTSAVLEGAKCLQYRCAGTYRASDAGSDNNYYRQVYNRRRAPRVYATDHTGLLERKTRELVERDFKLRKRFNSLNALVATSTLEMGIDIGDLNITMNGDVPPLPSNFLQRVGRAGRKSGSALIVNFVAAAEPHDLYYFEEPREMMEGMVSTPGCYLDAREILKRHYYAYCMDSWASAHPETSHIPIFVRDLKPAMFNPDDPQFFINRWLRYIKDHQVQLLKRFKQAYSGQVDEKVFDDLEGSFLTGSFYDFPGKVFERLKQEYDLLRKKRQEISESIREKKLAKEDPERIELENERKNLLGTLKAIEKRHVLEFMTNAGMLPNYAFPETGVTLNARVAGIRSEDSEAPPAARDIELVRPARQAIKELPPDSHFYTQGFKLKVSGLNVINWKEEATVFRFCSNCDHIMEEGLAPKTPCPKCGDRSWESATNKHTFLKFHAVKSFNTEANARLDDSSEERDRHLTIRTRHFRLPEETTFGAFALKKIPFGIEFVRQMEIMEANAGIATDFFDKNRGLKMNGADVPGAGYITCRYCGLASSFTHKLEKGRWVAREPRDYHYPYCKHREQAYQGKADEVFEEVYLYRNMQTEALKILLPVQEFESENMVGMFKAGLEHGLKRYYKGNPQHLEIREYAEFNQATRKMDRYLLLFDTIPGGTGYLEKLFEPQAFSEVLKLAYINIRDCGCQHTGKDGCYHCIYSYGNQYERGVLSRSKAEALFYKIIASIDTWEAVPNGLGKITNTGFIEESELEDRFIKTLREHYLSEEGRASGNQFEEVMREGVICYRLKVVNEEHALEYEIQPQVQLGPSQGVKYSTIADFLIRCVGATISGRNVPLQELYGFRPIAVYLDGYLFHASRENPRFENDLKRRRAINESGKYLTWTLTWDDLSLFKKNEPDLLGKTFSDNTKTREQLKKIPKYQHLNPAWQEAENNLRRLLWMLEQGIHRPFADLNKHFRYVIASLQPRFGGYCLQPSEAAYFVATGNRQEGIKPGSSGEEYYEIPMPEGGTALEYRLMERLKDLDLKAQVTVHPQADGYPKAEWELFWHVYNLLQLEQSSELRISFGEGEPGEDYSEDEVLAYYDEEYHTIVKQLLAHQLPLKRTARLF